MAEIMHKLEVLKEIGEFVGALGLAGFAYYYGIGYALDAARWFQSWRRS